MINISICFGQENNLQIVKHVHWDKRTADLGSLDVLRKLHFVPIMFLCIMSMSAYVYLLEGHIIYLEVCTDQPSESLKLYE